MPSAACACMFGDIRRVSASLSLEEPLRESISIISLFITPMFFGVLDLLKLRVGSSRGSGHTSR